MHWSLTRIWRSYSTSLCKTSNQTARNPPKSIHHNRSSSLPNTLLFPGIYPSPIWLWQTAATRVLVTARYSCHEIPRRRVETELYPLLMLVPHSEQAELYPKSNSTQQAKFHGTKFRGTKRNLEPLYFRMLYLSLKQPTHSKIITMHFSTYGVLEKMLEMTCNSRTCLIPRKEAFSNAQLIISLRLPPPPVCGLFL